MVEILDGTSSRDPWIPSFPSTYNHPSFSPVHSSALGNLLTCRRGWSITEDVGWDPWVCTGSRESVYAWGCIWDVFLTYWGRRAEQPRVHHYLFLALVSLSKMWGSGRIPPKALTLFHLQMLPLWTQSPWKTEWWMARWILPAQTLTITWALPHIQCSCLQISCLSTSFLPFSSQDPTAEDTQDVIHAHMNRCTLSETIFTPIPLSPTSSSYESSIYMALNVNQDHAETWPGPRLWAHRVLQSKDLYLFLKGLLHGHSSFSSNPAPQLWG